MYAPIYLTAHGQQGKKNITYGDLLSYGDRRLPHIYTGKSAESQIEIAKSQLTGLLKVLGKCLEDTVEDDLGDQFKNNVALRMEVIESKGYKAQVSHYLITWRKLYDEMVAHPRLPPDFAGALDHLMKKLGLSDSEVEEALGIRTGRIKLYRSGESEPSRSRGMVQGLEEFLEVPGGTLTSRLVFQAPDSGKLLEPFVHLLPDECLGAGNAQEKRQRLCRQLPENFASLSSGEQEALVRRAVAVQIYGNPYRGRLSAQVKNPYRLKTWPAQAQQEWEKLVKVKKGLAPPRDFRRNGRWATDETVRVHRQMMEALYGYGVADSQAEDSMLLGAGLQPEELSLALILVPEFVDGFLNFYFEERGTGINGRHDTYLKFFDSLLREETGWLRQNEGTFRGRLPEAYLRATESLTWDEICDRAREANRDHRDGTKEIRDIDKKSRDTFLPILPILENDHPVSYLDRMHDLILEELGWPDKITDPELFQTCFLSRLLSRFPFRREHWVIATYLPNNEGHLYRNEAEQFCLRFKVHEFKNESSGQFDKLQSDNYAFNRPLPNSLQREAEVFVTHVRPCLLNGQHCDALFTHNQKPVTGKWVHDKIFGLTERYLSEYDSRGLQVRGVHPFGPHAYRDIVGTEAAKMHSIAHAAAILMISEAVAERHYARFLPNDRYNKAFNQVFPDD